MANDETIKLFEVVAENGEPLPVMLSFPPELPGLRSLGEHPPHLEIGDDITVRIIAGPDKSDSAEHPLKASVVPGLARELVVLADRIDEIIFDPALTPFYRDYYSPELMLPGLQYTERKIHEMIEKMHAQACEEGNEHG